jgi:hypothetical protein
MRPVLEELSGMEDAATALLERLDGFLAERESSYVVGPGTWKAAVREGDDAVSRDEFREETKSILAKRVGMRCSNPNCRRLTSGPSTEPARAISVGVASHITAAASGGPRHDPQLSSEERRSPENGIWLCTFHGRLVDTDAERYPIEMLNKWKDMSEQAALLELEGAGQRSGLPEFVLVQECMEQLLREIQQDVIEDKSRVVREFIVLRSERIIFNHEKTRFQYYEESHEELRNKIGLLIEFGLVDVTDYTRSGDPIYRMKQNFIEMLKEWTPVEAGPQSSCS